MKFGKSYNQEEDATTGGSDFLRYFKKPETTFRVLQDSDDWIDYWEHFNPGGYPFPCTRDRDTCPGCTSNIDKMKKASKRVVIQVLEGEYVNAYKIPKTVADKLHAREERNGTISDRDYTIYRIQTKNADGSTKTDYDVEGGDKIPVDVSALREKFKDVEAILTKMYEDAWGDEDKAMQTRDKAEQNQRQDEIEEQLSDPDNAPTWAKDEPEPNKEWTEEELRALPFSELIDVCATEGMNVPQELRDQKDANKVVDWLLDQ